MDISDRRPNVHVTIQKGLYTPTLKKCIDCCYPPKYHCPFCLPSFFKPTKYSRARLHLDIHLRRAIYVGEYTIHKCALDCRNQAHYHCLFCTDTLIKQRDFKNHLPCCHQAQQQRILSDLQTAATHRVQTEGSLIPGEGDIATFEIENDDDSDDDVTSIVDSDDQHSPGASSSQLVQRDTVGMKRSTDPSKCDRTVQTNIEKPQDCDEYYFMGLVKMFKKLSPRKKAEVRMKIERLIFEAEFE
ncbi:uncharacterized protein LOC119500662 [Sebastes umbrosus]|uniref:uncharacterized protein LOC119500662 n=1 Tax=Sebastes umbrosus TaxID=72105 RepID=UPI00189D28B8|nr:uncharacterized protein LOC119500662 [Sebastes umbrosus]